LPDCAPWWRLQPQPVARRRPQGSPPLPKAKPKFVVNDKITMMPGAIMQKMFEIQGIQYDMTSGGEEAVLEKIANVVGTGPANAPCNGQDSFDCFISYRVSADREAAGRIYEYLASKGIHTFLDSKCLKDGMPWKDGFVQGLMNSRLFLGLMSTDAFAPVRDLRKDHTYDNV
jgi:hypothetical protein